MCAFITQREGLEMPSAREHLPPMLEALGLVLYTAKTKNQAKYVKQTLGKNDQQ